MKTRDTTLNNKITLLRFIDGEYFPPFGIMSIASQLKKEGFDPKIINLRTCETRLPELVAQLDGNLMIGVSALTSEALVPTLELCEGIKASYGDTVKIVWGGQHTTFLPEITLKENSVDYVISGEGEEPLVQLARYIQTGMGDLKSIPGLGFKDGDGVHIAPKTLLKSLDDYPYAWDLIDVEKYLQKGFGYKRILPYISSRGCPYPCTFCYNIPFNNQTWRGPSAPKVVEDINYLKEKYDIDAVYFYDDYYFTNHKRVKEIASGIDLPWYSELRATDIKAKRIRELKQLNALGFVFGAESGSATVLKTIEKGIVPEDILNAAKVCQEGDIKELHMSFIFFTPGETIEDVKDTSLIITKLMREYPFVRVGGGTYTPYPGVELTSKTMELGWVPLTTTEGWAEYHRATEPQKLGIFSDEYIRNGLKVKDASMKTAAFYHFLYCRLKWVGTVINYSIRPFSLLFDYLIRKDVTLYPFEYHLYRVLYLFKRGYQKISPNFNPLVSKPKSTG